MRLPRAKFYNAVVKDFYESFKELIWKPQKGLVSLASTVVKISHQKLVCVCVWELWEWKEAINLTGWK